MCKCTALLQRKLQSCWLSWAADQRQIGTEKSLWEAKKWMLMENTCLLFLWLNINLLTAADKEWLVRHVQERSVALSEEFQFGFWFTSFSNIFVHITNTNKFWTLWITWDVPSRDVTHACGMKDVCFGGASVVDYVTGKQTVRAGAPSFGKRTVWPDPMINSCLGRTHGNTAGHNARQRCCISAQTWQLGWREDMIKKNISHQGSSLVFF